MAGFLLSMLAAAIAPATVVPAAAAAEIVVSGDRSHAAMPGLRVADPELAQMRGGLALPNGLNVIIGIDVQTRIDGVLALHTIYQSDGPGAGLRVYTDGTDSPRVAPGTATVTTQASGGGLLLTVARSPAGTTIAASPPVPAATVNLVNDVQSTWLTAEGQTQVPVVANGPAAVTPAGTISISNDGSGPVVTLDASMLQVRQLIGQATGAVIANTGNDRAIDTVSSVNVDLQGLSPALMASIFDAQRVVFDAMTR